MTIFGKVGLPGDQSSTVSACCSKSAGWGVVALALLLLQPLLTGGYLPNLTARRVRQLHAGVGALLLTALVPYVAGLRLTSPPDVIDALLFRSPTPFSAWGVIALWAVFATALLATFRRRLRLKPTIWRTCHLTLAAVMVGGTVVHAMLIEGTMGTLSKAALCALDLAAAMKVVVERRPWRVVMRLRA